MPLVRGKHCGNRETWNGSLRPSYRRTQNFTPFTAFNKNRAFLLMLPVSTIWSPNTSQLGTGPRARPQTGRYCLRIAKPSRHVQTRRPSHLSWHNIYGRRSLSHCTTRPCNKTWTLPSDPPRPWRNFGRPSSITRAAQRRGPPASRTTWWRAGPIQSLPKCTNYWLLRSVVPPLRGSNGHGYAPNPKTPNRALLWTVSDLSCS